MNTLHVLFKTGRFNLSKLGQHFINPCWFAEDLAGWIRLKLIERRIEVPEPYQEDWDWGLPEMHGSDAYYLWMNGNSDEPSTSKDAGGWWIVVEKRRSIGHCYSAFPPARSAHRE